MDRISFKNIIANVLEFFKKMGCYYENFENIIYLTVKDAILYIESR
jgi:hypothetical protein